jgi:hypothetical protein
MQANYVFRQGSGHSPEVPMGKEREALANAASDLISSNHVSGQVPRSLSFV